MKTDKRYRIEIDLYLFAKTDSGAQKKAFALVRRVRKRYPDAEPILQKLFISPFASAREKQIL